VPSVGREQRSRRYLPAGTRTICYLCGHEIAPEQPWNRDHVPPQRFYGKSIREAFNPNLGWLYTHNACNTAYKDDEEYYVAALSGHAVESDTGRSVFADFRRGVERGHDTGLLKTVVSQFGTVITTDGSRLFHYDVRRVERITWKLVRGIYFRETEGRVLPDTTQQKRVFLLTPDHTKDIDARFPWWHLVRDTEPMGDYGKVFDYKWLGVVMEGGRMHALGILLWDRLLLLALFHDPSCVCWECRGEV
jgi:hypothetical protein